MRINVKINIGRVADVDGVRGNEDGGAALHKYIDPAVDEVFAICTTPTYYMGPGTIRKEDSKMDYRQRIKQ